MPELQVLIEVRGGMVQEIKMDPGVVVTVADGDDGSLSVHRLVEPGRMETMDGVLPVPMTHSVPRDVATLEIPVIASPVELDGMGLAELERYRDRWCHWVLNYARLWHGIEMIAAEFGGNEAVLEYEWRTEFGLMRIAQPYAESKTVCVDVADNPIAPKWLKLLQLTKGIDSGQVYVSMLMPGEWVLGLLATIGEAKNLAAQRANAKELAMAATLRGAMMPWPL